MSAPRLFFFLLLFSFPLHTGAAVSADDLPGDTIWYMHADLEQLRTAESGKGISRWMDSEIVIEIRDEFGVDLNSEVNSITAFSDASNGTVIVIDGPVTKKTQDKLLALAVLETDIDTREHDGDTYYFAGDDEAVAGNDPDPFEDLEDFISQDELRALSDRYKDIAGFSLESLNPDRR